MEEILQIGSNSIGKFSGDRIGEQYRPYASPTHTPRHSWQNGLVLIGLRMSHATFMNSQNVFAILFHSCT